MKDESKKVAAMTHAHGSDSVLPEAATQVNKPLISIVICTYNRARLALNTVLNLCDQTLEKSSYEILVIDNNSKDNTYDLVNHYCSGYSNVFYHKEQKQGLSHARNCGLQNAKGEYIGYIDDDCLIPNGFLSVARDIIEQLSPGIFGGPSYSFYHSTKPRWYRDRYGANEPYKAQRRLRQNECEHIYGCNMFFRKSILESIGGFDPALGMSGEKIFYGEETAVIHKAIEKFLEELVYYDPRLYLYHLVQDERMRLKWFFRMYFAQGGASYRLQRYRTARGRLISPSKYNVLKQLMHVSLIMGMDLVRGIYSRNRHQYPYWQNYVVEKISRHIKKIGLLVEQYKFGPD